MEEFQKYDLTLILHAINNDSNNYTTFRGFSFKGSMISIVLLLYYNRTIEQWLKILKCDLELI